MKKISKNNLVFISLILLFILVGCTEENEYSVKFLDSNNSVISEQIILSGEDATPPNPPSKEGYHFIDWNQSYENIMEDLLIEPVYEVILIEIIFEENDGSVLETILVEYGNDVIAPEALEIEGMEFIEWDQTLNNITESKTIKPIYEVLVYDVHIYDIDQTLLETLQITHGGIIESLREYETENFEYIWFNEDDNKTVKFPLTINQSRSFYSDWYSKGLEFNRLNQEYSVSAGDVADDYVKIPAYYQNLPVTSIDKYGFSNHSLSKLFIPFTIKTIQERAFESTKNLNQVIFEDDSNLEIIGFDAFARTESLKEIILPESILTLGQGAFYLSGIERIDISSSLNSIGPYALTHAYKLSEINVDEKNRIFSSVSGILYSKNQTQLIIFPSGLDSIEFELLDTTEEILSGALEGVSLKRLILPKSLKAINSHSFSGSNIENLFFPNGANENLTIQKDAFIYGFSDMNIYIEDSYYQSLVIQNVLNDNELDFKTNPLSNWEWPEESLKILNNSWIVSNDLLIEDNIQIFNDWNTLSNNDYVYTYFYLKQSGSLNLFFAFDSSLDSTIEITFNDDIRQIDLKEVDGEYVWGEVSYIEKGHYFIKIKILSNNSTNPFNLEEIKVEGSSSDRGIGQIPPNETQMPASLHLWPQVSNDFGDIEWLYSEILIEEDNDVLYTYFVANGFAEGYFGFQTNTLNVEERWVLFSVWSPYETDDPNEIPDDLKVRLIRKGENVVVREFGAEGSGGQSYLEYPWVTGQRYGFLTQIKPTGDNQTHYSSYFYDPNIDEWFFIATLERPETNTYAKNWYQFIEVYLENYGNIERTGHYGNYWVRNTEGVWNSVNSAYLTATNNANLGYRNDIDAGSSEYVGMLYLKTGGFETMPVEINRTLFINQLGEEPDIDFDLLP